MLVWGVYLIHDGVISGGALIGAVMFAGRAVAPLSSVVSLATRYQGARAAMVSLDRLMSLPTEREPGKTYVANHRLSGRIALADLSFAYPDHEGDKSPRVLKGINLAFEPGERVAILGRIGSGKSTVLRLLASLYQPSEGRVLADGVDLRQIDPADFRAKVGFVSQEPRLFNGTLRDNVLMGRAGIDTLQLAHVARLTGLDRMVATHPKGWELSVGEMGNMLSGGQRQLVALARCLVTQPQILLMDEPTSSMDAQSELMFLRQLKEAVGTRTLIVVTHRPAVLDLVQRVVVIDAGKVALDGPKPLVLAALAGAAPPMPGQTGAPTLPQRPAQPAQAAMSAPDAAAGDATDGSADGCSEGCECARPSGRGGDGLTMFWQSNKADAARAPHRTETPYLSPLRAAQVVDATPGTSWALYLMALIVMSALAWASLARVDDITRADGRIVPDGREQVIASLEGGILRELHVREGMQVEAGQDLAHDRPDAIRIAAERRPGQTAGAAGHDRAPERRSDWQGAELPAPKWPRCRGW